jgi:uncharacterized protein
VAQTCNLACGYCYAQGGEFGDAAKSMSWDVARAAVERLFDSILPGQKAYLAFLGGEPLINRSLIRKTTQFATTRAKAKNAEVGFSVTTNGTLVEPEDAEFFEEYGFAVTVSLDGVGATHDRLRSFRGGEGSYDRILRRIDCLLQRQQRMQVSARVTVTPANLSLVETLNAFLDIGFHSVGFSPMLSSPMGLFQLNEPDFQPLLDNIIKCGREFERRVLRGERYAFSNMSAAMQEIHRGSHRPYPCGAGAGYMGVSATGDLSACHRFVESSVGAMGNVFDGIDQTSRNSWLADRHVHRQEPCRGCWARYLCGGGCHHEVIHRGRPACDYIRGWLDYCLQAYVRLLDARPDYFGQ